MKRLAIMFLAAASLLFCATSCFVDNATDVTVNISNSYTNGLDALSAYTKASEIFSQEIRKAGNPDMLGSVMVFRNQKNIKNASSLVKQGAANAEAKILAGQTGYVLSKTSVKDKGVFGVEISLSGFGEEVVYDQYFLIEDQD